MMDYSRGAPEPAGPMDGNPHYELAVKIAENRRSRFQPTPEQAMYDAALQQAESTMALAYEQRTANMIALLAMGVTDMSDWPPQASQVWHESLMEVNKRLGVFK